MRTTRLCGFAIALSLLVSTTAILSATTVHAAGQSRPNVVLIMTDNHGPWSLGCYGNEDVRTPHIDRLAEEGALFTRAFANNAVCSPTRATVLTGLMPCQHGVHRYLGGGAAQVGPDAYNMLEEFETIPSLLVDAGYTAGLTGKWHLGGNMEPQEGFTYWITKPHGSSAGFYNQQVIENGEIRREPQYLTELWTDHAVRFIEQNREQPFFLFLAYNGPYGLGGAMREPIRNRHRDYYADHDLPSFPRTEPQPWNHNYGEWIGDLQIARKYAAEVSGIDDGVGRVMETLRKLGLDENTLVIFTADQGLSGGHAGYWGMGDHTRPLTAFDWTMTIPLIIRQPGRIPAGQRIDNLVSNYDLFPTLLSYLGMEDKLPASRSYPGRDFSPLLLGEELDWENVHFYEFENVRAIRTDRWKYIERIHQTPNELYDLADDPNEHHNLYGDREYAATVQKLRQRLHAFFDKHADPKWDLWHGGGSKTDLMTEQFFGLKNPYRPSRYAPDQPVTPARVP
ncbi:sulfatase-like hydrolase/transferase [Maioricimonas sp. JC845]|uniref:sulfatase family protein n=1 Tax=Maioricimonas sp. JC845 TaxID=3232138 RepID=UPI00345B429D